jgi:hypothetical protein
LTLIIGPVAGATSGVASVSVGVSLGDSDVAGDDDSEVSGACDASPVPSSEVAPQAARTRVRRTATTAASERAITRSAFRDDDEDPRLHTTT